MSCILGSGAWGPGEPIRPFYAVVIRYIACFIRYEIARSGEPSISRSCDLSFDRRSHARPNKYHTNQVRGGNTSVEPPPPKYGHPVRPHYSRYDLTEQLPRHSRRVGSVEITDSQSIPRGDSFGRMLPHHFEDPVAGRTGCRVGADASHQNIRHRNTPHTVWAPAPPSRLAFEGCQHYCTLVGWTTRRRKQRHLSLGRSASASCCHLDARISWQAAFTRQPPPPVDGFTSYLV